MNTEIQYEKSTPPKKIGREVQFIEAKKDTPRNGQGTFIRLQNGDVFYAYSENFDGEKWADEAKSHIVGCVSHDEGESFGERFLVYGLPEGYRTVKCPSLLRLADGDIAMVFMARLPNNSFQIFFARSKDECKTWSAVATLAGEDIDGCHAAYNVMNDRFLELESGRLIIPTEAILFEKKADGSYGYKGEECFLCTVYSDDGGKTWVNGRQMLTVPYIKTVHGLQEPGLIVMPDGRLRMYARTNLGCQYECYSSDGGTSWSVPVPMEYFKSPLSPMMIKHVGEYTVAVYNPEPIHILPVRPQLYVRNNCTLLTDRTPLVISVSEDGGESFSRLFVLEDDPYSYFCYPAVFDGGDYILVSYYHSNRTESLLSSSKTVKIMKEELG